MENKPTTQQRDKAPEQEAFNNNAHPLRYLSADEFAALGGDNTVFVRTISAKQLAEFLPEAKSMPDDVQFQLIMGADGAPILITDSQTALADWFENNDFSQVQRH